ncbi:DoxX family membrane protein [Halorubraceae archaeon YAN]|nr:DoxX family membrane protein [Halorubraceae archaeon YAN]
MSTKATNKFESSLAGITLEGEPHSLSAWFVVTLRLVMGGMILFAGLDKFAFVSGEAFNASGYLANVDPASPVSGLFGAMAASPALMELINVIVPVTQVLIGVALIFGGFVRLAALGGALQMSMFYLGGWEGDILAAFDSTLIYAIVFLAIGAFAAGRILGADKYIEQVEIGGEPLIEKYPRARYFLG